MQRSETLVKHNRAWMEGCSADALFCVIRLFEQRWKMWGSNLSSCACFGVSSGMRTLLRRGAACWAFSSVWLFVPCFPFLGLGLCGLAWSPFGSFSVLRPWALSGPGRVRGVHFGFTKYGSQAPCKLFHGTSGHSETGFTEVWSKHPINVFFANKLSSSFHRVHVVCVKGSKPCERGGYHMECLARVGNGRPLLELGSRSRCPGRWGKPTRMRGITILV